MGLFGKKINPATGRPHSMDKKLGADRKGMERRKRELEERAKKTRRMLQQNQSRKKAGKN